MSKVNGQRGEAGGATWPHMWSPQSCQSQGVTSPQSDSGNTFQCGSDREERLWGGVSVGVCECVHECERVSMSGRVRVSAQVCEYCVNVCMWECVSV